MAHRSHGRTADRRRERFDAADGRIRSRAWSDAVRTLARDPGARVPVRPVQRAS